MRKQKKRGARRYAGVLNPSPSAVPLERDPTMDADVVVSDRYRAHHDYGAAIDAVGIDWRAKMLEEGWVETNDGGLCLPRKAVKK